MREIISNEYNLREIDMTEVVKRVKVLIINSKNEILLGYSHHDYQFPGGHVEEKETLQDTLEREIREETGIHLQDRNLIPFAKSLGYYKDWPAPGKNRKIEIYYYEVQTDEKPNLANTSYTENETEGNFKLEYIPLKNVEEVLKQNTKKYGDQKGIAKEMLELLDIYKSLKKDGNK